MYAKKTEKRNNGKVLVVVIFLYVIGLLGMIMLESGVDFWGSFLIGLMFIIGGILGLYTKTFALMPSNMIFANINNSYGNSDLKSGIGMVCNYLSIILGIIVMCS